MPAVSIPLDVRSIVPHRVHGEPRGELGLRRAVLFDALRRLHAPATRRRGRQAIATREAQAWLRSADRTWPYSFENLCDVLGLDSAAVRSAVLPRVAVPRLAAARALAGATLAPRRSGTMR